MKIRPEVSRFADLIDKKLREYDPEHKLEHRTMSKEALFNKLCEALDSAEDIEECDDNDALDGAVMVAAHMLMIADHIAFNGTKHEDSTVV